MMTKEEHAKLAYKNRVKKETKALVKDFGATKLDDGSLFVQLDEERSFVITFPERYPWVPPIIFPPVALGCAFGDHVDENCLTASSWSGFITVPGIMFALQSYNDLPTVAQLMYWKQRKK